MISLFFFFHFSFFNLVYIISFFVNHAHDSFSSCSLTIFIVSKDHRNRVKFCTSSIMELSLREVHSCTQGFFLFYIYIYIYMQYFLLHFVTFSWHTYLRCGTWVIHLSQVLRFESTWDAGLRLSISLKCVIFFESTWDAGLGLSISLKCVIFYLFILYINNCENWLLLLFLSF